MSPPPPRLQDLLAHAEWLRRLAVHVARGRDAEDAVQDTWLAALRTPPDPTRPARPWLAEVLRNFVRRRARHERPRALAEPSARTRPDAEPRGAGAGEAAVPSAEALLERAEAQRILAELVVALPEPYRGAVMLRYYEGLTSAEIAAAHGVPAGTVRWRLKEGLARLRVGLDERYGGDRRAWCLALVPLARPRTLPLAGGALLMAMKTKIAVSGALVALVLLLGGVAVWQLGSMGDRDSAGRGTAAPGNGPAVARAARAFAEDWARKGGGRPGTIEGVVREPAGTSVGGALVALIEAVRPDPPDDMAAPRPRAIVRSAADGAFKFGDVPPGVYLLTATAAGWAPAETADLPVVPGESIRGVELVLATGGARLFGAVSDAGGGPIGGAALRALALGAGGRTQGARTFLVVSDDRGQYELRLQRGGLRVVADAEGYAPEAVTLWLAVEQRRDFRLAPAARLSGRVLHQGAPVPNARIRVESQAVVRAVARAAISDAAGAFVMASLPAGTYVALAHSGPLVGRARQPLTLAPGAASEVVIELARGVAVAGVTRDREGRPIAGALVRAGANPATASSDGQGRFRLEGFPPGRHRLAAEAPGYAGASLRVAVEAKDVDGIDFALAAEARLRGRVLDRQERPVPGASVLVGEDLPNEATTNFALARTDEQGQYEVGGLAPGELRVEAEHPHAGRGIAGPILVAPGAVQEVDVRMGSGGGLVRGAVRWEDGEPAAGVIVRGAVKGRRSVSGVTDGQGRFEIGPFTPADVNVNAWPETDALGGGPGTAKTVALPPGEDRDGVDLIIPRRDERIAGAVFGPDGSPIPGAAVGVAPDHRGVSFRPFNKYASGIDGGNYSVLSDAMGAFTVRFLPKGKYTVWATHPEFPEADAYDVAAGSRGVRLQFARPAALAGRADDATGKPLAAFTVFASLSHENAATPQLRSTRGYVQQWAAVQDPSGAFELTGLHAAIYDVLVVAPDRRIGHVRDVHVGAGEIKRDLRVAVGEGVRVKGRLVYAQNGQPVAGVWLSISLAMLHEQVRAQTDGDGRFALDAIPAGKFVLHLPGDPRTREAQNQPIEVPAGVREHDIGTVPLTRRRPPAAP
jgi:RNA polymerase sigma factor (sigma-70 family)